MKFGQKNADCSQTLGPDKCLQDCILEDSKDDASTI